MKKNDFIKKMLELAIELDKAEGLDVLTISEEINRVYDEHFSYIKSTNEEHHISLKRACYNELAEFIEDARERNPSIVLSDHHKIVMILLNYMKADINETTDK